MAGKKLPVTLTGEVAELRRQVARLRVAAATPAAGGTPRCSTGYYADDIPAYTAEVASGNCYPAWVVDVTDGADHPTLASGTVSGQTYYTFQVNADGLYTARAYAQVTMTAPSFPRRLEWTLVPFTSNGGPDTYQDVSSGGMQQINHSPTSFAIDTQIPPVYMKSGGQFFFALASDWPTYGASASVSSAITVLGAYVARVA